MNDEKEKNRGKKKWLIKKKKKINNGPSRSTINLIMKGAILL